MNVGIYDIINKPLPKLFFIKDIECYAPDFYTPEMMADMLNGELELCNYTSEHLFCVAIDSSYNPKGILQLGIGNTDSVIVDIKKLGMGLLLLGADGFACFHNHPTGDIKPSLDDVKMTKEMKKLSNIIEMKFFGHFVVTENSLIECISKNLKEV